jgi:hypothetical protein
MFIGKLMPLFWSSRIHLHGSPRKVGFLMVKVTVSFEALVLNYQSEHDALSQKNVFLR